MSFKIHLRDQLVVPTFSELKMDMWGPVPICICRICPWDNCFKSISPGFIAHSPAPILKVWIEWSGIGITGFVVAARSTGLQNLNRRSRHWNAMLILNDTLNVNHLTERQP